MWKWYVIESILYFSCFECVLATAILRKQFYKIVKINHAFLWLNKIKIVKKYEAHPTGSILFSKVNVIMIKQTWRAWGYGYGCGHGRGRDRKNKYVSSYIKKWNNKENK